MKMQKRKILLILSITLIFIQSSFSQEKLTLTLDKSVQIALTQNPYHLATEERVEAAYSQLRQAASGFLPSLNAQGLHTLDEKVMELEFPSFIPGEPPQRVEVDFTRDYQFSMSFALPLFTSGRLTSGYKQAKFNLQSTKEAVRQSKHITVFNTKRAFYGHLLAKEFVSVAEEAVRVAEENLENVKNMYEVGMASKMDLLRSEVRLTNMQPEVIAAKNNLRISELNLKTVLGMDLSQPVEIEGVLSYEPLEPDLEESITTALAHRPEVKQFEFQRKMARENLKLSRAGYFPSLSVSGSYSFWADKLNFRKETWSSFYAINLVLNIPIFNGFKESAQIAQSKAMIREIDLNQKALRDAVELEVRQAALMLKEAKETLLSQEKNTEQAKESLRITQLNFSEGMATTLDVISAEAAYSQAQVNYSQALFNYVLAVAELDRAMGVGYEDYDG
jgi:outer membrane protein TolC